MTIKYKFPLVRNIRINPEGTICIIDDGTEYHSTYIINASPKDVFIIDKENINRYYLIKCGHSKSFSFDIVGSGFLIKTA